MRKELARKIVDGIAQALSQFDFSERHDQVTDTIVGVVKKPWSGLCRLLGGHGISAVVVVPESVTECSGLKAFFGGVRREINARYVGFAAYKSSHSFIVLVCPHALFTACSGIASRLKDRTGLHVNIIQGVILVDGETGEVSGDYTRPAQYKREYEAVLSATKRAVEEYSNTPQ